MLPKKSSCVRRIVFVVALALSLGGLALAQSGGDGSSIEQAIVITGAANTLEGIAKESEWIRQNLRGWRKVGQALLQADGRRYDRIDLAGPNGATKAIYFDITSFFGKL